MLWISAAALGVTYTAFPPVLSAKYDCTYAYGGTVLSGC